MEVARPLPRARNLLEKKEGDLLERIHDVFDPGVAGPAHGRVNRSEYPARSSSPFRPDVRSGSRKDEPDRGRRPLPPTSLYLRHVVKIGSAGLPRGCVPQICHLDL